MPSKSCKCDSKLLDRTMVTATATSCVMIGGLGELDDVIETTFEQPER